MPSPARRQPWAGLAWPARCEVCRAWPARPVCADCEARFAAARPRCRLCALLVPAGQPVCGACLHRPPPWAACHAAVTWGYPWDGLIGRFKFGGEPGWAGTLADLLLRDATVRAAVDAAAWLVPMPLAPARLAARGYNQAHALARRLRPGRSLPGAVVRQRETTPQAGLDHDRRLTNLRGAFRPGPQADHLRGQSVVLVDDVMTTGASLMAVAGVLQGLGAGPITCVVLARTEDSGRQAPQG